MRSQTLVLGSDGIVSLRAGCRLSKPCMGYVLLYSSSAGELGRADFAVGALRAGSVNIALSRAGIRAVRKRRRISDVRATVALDQGEGLSTSDPLTVKVKPKARGRAPRRR